jgi:hypothetical protein
LGYVQVLEHITGRENATTISADEFEAFCNLDLTATNEDATQGPLDSSGQDEQPVEVAAEKPMHDSTPGSSTT